MTAAEKQVRDRLLGAVWTPWPVLPALTREQLLAAFNEPGGIGKVTDYFHRREKMYVAAMADPWRSGHKPKSWQDVRAALKIHDEVLVMGGNRSGKTECAADYVVGEMETRSNLIVGCFHSSADSSIRQQQRRIYEYLPPEHRNLKKTKFVNVSFSKKNGFSDNVFLLPNGSESYFFNYGQDIKVIEGYEFDICWCDELVTPEWLEALRYRLVTRRGKLLITFTPVDGYTPAVAEYVAGATPVKTKAADPELLSPDKVHVKDCPPGTMPYELAGARAERRVFFMFSKDNIFSPYEEIVKKVTGLPPAKIMERAYGWPSKLAGTAFPKFGKVHIVKRERLPEKCTRYCVCDPGDAKNWFIKWYAVDQNGWAYVYREWPDVQRHGYWGEPSSKNLDGRPGPAQRSEFGRGINDYKQMIMEAEGWVWDEDRKKWTGDEAEEIYERIMDSRLGGAEVPSMEGGTSIISLMGEADYDRDDVVVMPEMHWVPASGARIKGGLQQINEWLSYEQTQPVTVENCPRLYVMEDCLNTIYALQEYTGLGGEKGAWKDVVDCDRYFVSAEPEYVAPGQKMYVGGGAYGAGMRRN